MPQPYFNNREIYVNSMTRPMPVDFYQVGQFMEPVPRPRNSFSIGDIISTIRDVKLNPGNYSPDEIQRARELSMEYLGKDIHFDEDVGRILGNAAYGLGDAITFGLLDYVIPNDIKPHSLTTADKIADFLGNGIAWFTPVGPMATGTRIASKILPKVGKKLVTSGVTRAAERALEGTAKAGEAAATASKAGEAAAAAQEMMNMQKFGQWLQTKGAAERIGSAIGGGFSFSHGINPLGLALGAVFPHRLNADGFFGRSFKSPNNANAVAGDEIIKPINEALGTNFNQKSLSEIYNKWFAQNPDKKANDFIDFMINLNKPSFAANVDDAVAAADKLLTGMTDKVNQATGLNLSKNVVEKEFKDWAAKNPNIQLSDNVDEFINYLKEKSAASVSTAPSAPVTPPPVTVAPVTPVASTPAVPVNIAAVENIAPKLLPEPVLNPIPYQFLNLKGINASINPRAVAENLTQNINRSLNANLTVDEINNLYSQWYRSGRPGEFANFVKQSIGQEVASSAPVITTPASTVEKVVANDVKPIKAKKAEVITSPSVNKTINQATNPGVSRMQLLANEVEKLTGVNYSEEAVTRIFNDFIAKNPKSTINEFFDYIKNYTANSANKATAATSSAVETALTSSPTSAVAEKIATPSVTPVTNKIVPEVSPVNSARTQTTHSSNSAGSKIDETITKSKTGINVLDNVVEESSNPYANLSMDELRAFERAVEEGNWGKAFGYTEETIPEIIKHQEGTIPEIIKHKIAVNQISKTISELESLMKKMTDYKRFIQW
jgi:hypothetical protein